MHDYNGMDIKMPKDSYEAVRLIQEVEGKLKSMDELDKELFNPEHADATVCYYSDNLAILKDGEEYIFIGLVNDSPSPVERRLTLTGGE